MAAHIRFRWTRTKAGVTMAFLALLGGLGDSAASAQDAHGAARAAASASFFPRLSFNHVGRGVKSAFIKLDKDLQTAFRKATTEAAVLKGNVIELKSNVIELKSNVTELNSNVSELKSNVYTKAEANSTFMKSGAAAAEFLSKDGTAANANKLGGLGASAFIHGTGGIATGTATAKLGGNSMPLVTSGDGSLVVRAQVTAGAGPAFTITNSTTEAMTWIATVDGTVTDGSLSAGATSVPLVINDGNDVGQATVQLLPAVQNQAFTLTVSTEPATGGGQRFVGQMLNGDG